ncbi:MAG: hypothetical protein QOD77_243 [Thermoplasmata archaeon]|nr:hypothetical protein [Thermoplasmata archaeon]
MAREPDLVAPASVAAAQAGLFGGLLDRFCEVVGPAASEATFHYAAVQEGLRLGAGHGPKGLDSALAAVDAVLGHRSRLTADGDVLRLAITDSPILAGGKPVRLAVVRGLVEGTLRAVRGKAYTGKFLEGRAEGDEALLELRMEDDHDATN